VTSGALADLEGRLDEVRELTATDPARAGELLKPLLSGAISRASLVLLSAHLEGYLEDVIVEALDALASHSAAVDDVPLILRALHVEEHLGEIEPIKDRKARAVRIERLFVGESLLWTAGTTVNTKMLRHTTVCKEMSNPGSRDVRHFLELVGLDILDFLKARGSDRLLGQVDGLVGRRNAVAHGEVNASATYTDVDRYLNVVDDLANEIDAGVANALKKICRSNTLPW
jgi:hypothetical protein